MDLVGGEEAVGQVGRQADHRWYVA
jgi:hypothetical protein